MAVAKLAKVQYNEFFVNTLMDMVAKIIESEGQRIYVSQNQAYKRFGRVNVEKWVKLQRIKAFYRGNVIQYRMIELLEAAKNQQDYLY